MRGVRRRAHRPQLRLPGPQGDPQGRRRRAARGSAGCSARSSSTRSRAADAVRRAGDDEDPQGHRRRPPDLPRRRPDRAGDGLRGDRAARPHRRAGLLRRGRLGRDRARWSSTSTSRCSATATSGRPPTRCGWSSETGAAGVVVGRGCLGRPWLFRDLAAAFAGEQVATLPDARRGGRDDAPARRAARASTWGRSGAARSSASTCRGTSRASRPAASCAARWPWSTSLAELDELLAGLDPDEPFPVSELGTPRGRQGSPRDKVVLPEGWLDDTDGTGCGLTEDTNGDHRRVRSPLHPRRSRHRRFTLNRVGRGDLGHADRRTGDWPPLCRCG